MTLRLTLLAAAVAAAIGICLALGRWGAEGNRELAALLREVWRGEELPPTSKRGSAATRPSAPWRPRSSPGG